MAAPGYCLTLTCARPSHGHVASGDAIVVLDLNDLGFRPPPWANDEAEPAIGT